MFNRFATLTLGLTVLAVMFNSGCNDELKAKEAHIAVIEDANQRLNAELLAAKRDTDTLMSDRDRLKSELNTCQNQVGDLHARLNSRQEPVQTPTVLAGGWEAVPGGAMIAIEGGVLFPSGKAGLRFEGQRTLDGIASTLNSQYSDKDVMVFGHTDNVPIRKSGWKDNYELSAQRALSVVRYLSARGVSAARLIACGAGEHRPRAENTSDAGRSRNRRVEIFAVDPIQ